MPFKFPLGVPILNGFTHLKKVLSSVVRNLKAKQTLDLCKRFFVVSPIEMLSLLSNNYQISALKYVT